MTNRSFSYTGLLTLLVFIVLASCKKYNTDLPHPQQYAKIYMPQAIDYPAERNFAMVDTLQTIIIGADYGGVDYPGANINVTFKANLFLVDSFNLKNNTHYLPMPQGSYALDSSAVIKKSTLYTAPLHIKITTIGELEAHQSYLLPVSIDEVGNDIPVNEALRTTYFLIQGNFSDYNRSDWKVIDFDSQEAIGEGPNNGRAVFALDNNEDTYWHTQWNGAKPGPPHHITVDMDSLLSIHGFWFYPRKGQSTGNAEDIQITLSKDSIHWEDVGSFTLNNTEQRHEVYLASTQTARYFKIIINESWGNRYFTFFAEIGAF